MHKEINIGILHPASSIYPAMGKDFNKGIKLALQLDKKIYSRYTFNFTSEYIKQGDQNSATDCIIKLTDYEDVDIISGIINMRLLRLVHDIVDQKKTPFLANNLGEYIPKTEVKSEYIIGNSLNLWQSQYAMGYWAQKQYGGDPLICTSLYDGGYLLHNCFQLGAAAAGAKNVKTALMHLQQGVVDTSSLINEVKNEQPSHVHAILCGVDAKDFIKKYSEAGLKKNIPLTVSPFMTEDNLMNDIKDFIEGIPNAISWSLNLKNEKNENFISEYEKEYDQIPNVYSLLGYESGLAINSALNSIKDNKVNKNNLTKALTECKIGSPRGTFSLGFQNQDFLTLIRKPTLVNNHYENVILSTEKTVNFSNQALKESSANNISGWLNPYLCI